MGRLTIRVQFFGLHSQVIPGVDFSVQLSVVENVSLLAYLEELALVTGLADEVSARGKEIHDFRFPAESRSLGRETRASRLCPLHPPPLPLSAHHTLPSRGVQSSEATPWILAAVPSRAERGA